MSRNQPSVLLEYVDKTTYKCDQIIEASGIWAVHYDDQPINLKSSHYLTNDAAPKYKTDKFTVVFMNSGRKVYPDDISED